jgi:hypothetical protein
MICTLSKNPATGICSGGEGEVVDEVVVEVFVADYEWIHQCCVSSGIWAVM